MLLLSMCDSWTGSTLSASFYRRCTSSSPWIRIYYLRTCISLSKPDNVNHGILIAIVHPLQVRNWCSISCLTSMRRMIVLWLMNYPNREAQVLPTKVASYCEPHKQSTHRHWVLISQFEWVEYPRRDSNSRPTRCKRAALSLSYLGFCCWGIYPHNKSIITKFYELVKKNYQGTFMNRL